ncbi:MAG: hypothetical protein K2X87_12225 [Gemmataceae bacterium]|nr:hypothetical protein [Gemmataceae bacterium]
MSSATAGRPEYVLNIAPVDLAGGPVVAERLPYAAELLKDLHIRASETHVVRRDGDSILCVPLAQGPPSLGGEPVVIDLRENLYVAASLVRHALLAYLNKLGRTVLHFRPLTFLAGGKGDDYLGSALPPGVPNPGLLRVSPVFELDVRVITPEDQTPYVALTLNARVSRRILASCAELTRRGVDVRGVYVKRVAEIGDTRLAPKLETVGQVEAVEGDLLRLADHREEIPSIPAADAYPQSRADFFNRCVSVLFPRHASLILPKVEQAMANFRQGHQCLNRLRDVRGHLAARQLALPQGVTCTIHPFLTTGDDGDPSRFPKLRRARSPVYVFDPASTAKRCEWPPDGGLTRHGPYSSRRFTPNRPKVCVICQRSKKGQVEQFLVKFREGIRHDRDGIQPFEKGFVDKYALGGVEFEFFPAENNSAEAYRKTALAALASSGPAGQKWDLCFVQIEARFRDLPVPENPYMVCKAAFLTHQLPVQEFTVETTQLAPYPLSYALNNLGLATYAKMRGTPWLLQSDETVAQEMVVGLGSARIGDSRLGPGQRVVGITTVFTGDGNYCLSNLSGAASYETYQEELLTTLRLAVAQVRTDTQWQANRPVRLIFHLGFKQFCDEEIAAVKKVMAELGEFNAEFAFVQLVEDHPYRLFDLGQQGKFDTRTRRKKGVLGPPRGLYTLLSDREVLITLTGFQDVKRPEDGLPRPVLLKVHPDSTFADPVYLARQAYAFAGHSWQGFFPCGMPVTIEYSSMIARLLGQLATLPAWDPTALLGRVGWTRWFL